MNTEDLKARVVEAARRDQAMSEAASAARAELHEATLALLATGVSEVQAAKLAGVTRMTIRAWLGKR